MIRHVVLLVTALIVVVEAKVRPIPIYPLSQSPPLGPIFLQVLSSAVYSEPLPPDCKNSTLVNVSLKAKEDNVNSDLKSSHELITEVLIEFPRIIQVWKVRPFPVVSRFKQSGDYLLYIEHTIAEAKRKRARSKKAHEETKQGPDLMVNSSSLLLLRRFSKFVIQGSIFPTTDTVTKVARHYEQMQGALGDGITPMISAQERKEQIENDELEYLNFVEKVLHFAVKGISELHHLYVKRIQEAYDAISLKDKADSPSSKSALSFADKENLRQEAQKRSMSSALPFYVLGGRLLSMEPKTSHSGEFSIIIKILPKDTSTEIVNLKLTGEYNFEPQGDRSVSHFNWVSVGPLVQEEFILIDELSGETAVIDRSLFVHRCEYYRAMLSDTDPKSITISTFWNISDGNGGNDIVESVVTLSLEVDSHSEQQPYGYGVDTPLITYSEKEKKENISYGLGVPFFTFPFYARVIESMSNKTTLIPMYIYSIVGGGFMVNGDIDSFAVGFTGNNINWKQMSSTFIMIIIVAIIKFAPRMYLNYKGVDTKRLGEHLRGRGTIGGGSTVRSLPMRDEEASNIPHSSGDNSSSSFADMAASVVGSRKSGIQKMSAEEKQLLIKKQKEIIAQMKLQDGITK